MRAWTDADIDAAYFLGVIRAASYIPEDISISSMYLLDEDIKALNILGVRPHEMVANLRP